MTKVVVVLAVLGALWSLCSPATARADAVSLGHQCQDALTADDWGSAAAYCQDAYESLMNLSRSENSVRYQARDLADVDLGAAGYANMHFDPDTGRDQISRAQSDLQAMLADARCPGKEKDYITNHALPLVNAWAQYQPE